MNFEKLADEFIAEGGWQGSPRIAIELFAKWLAEHEAAQQKREPDVPKYPPVCTCSMDDGIHEWNCALEKARR